MSINDLYVLSEKSIRGCATVYNISKSGSCKDNNLEYRLSDSSGEKFYDLIYAGVGYFLVSAKVTDLLLTNNITGCEAKLTIIYDRKERIIEGYSFLQVTGRCGTVDWTKSQKFQKQFVPNAPYAPMLRGIYPDLSLWDGCDFCKADGTEFIFITDRVNDLFLNAKVTNVTMTKATEYEIMEPLPPPNKETEKRAAMFFHIL